MKNTTNRITRIVAVAVAGVAVGLATTFAVANGGGSDHNPATYHPAERAAIAEWATEHHLSGLSPESLTASDTAADPGMQRIAAEMAAIADYARAHHLSGLSPASLHPIGD